jgi:hypothetical protein
MSALTADRNTPRQEGEILEWPVKGSTKIYAGALVAVDASGYVKGGVTALALIGLGRAEAQVDNSAGADGALTIRVRPGTFRYDNSLSTDAITSANVGALCYIVDDHTVALTDGGGTRSRAGTVVFVDTIGVWVEFDADDVQSHVVGKVFVPLKVATIAGSNTYYAVTPVAGRVTKIWSIIEGVLTTGDATLTAKINGTGITTGVLTITQSGSAAGDVDSAVPTALNVVAAGDKLSLTVGGSNATATEADCIFEITT